MGKKKREDEEMQPLIPPEFLEEMPEEMRGLLQQWEAHQQEEFRELQTKYGTDDFYEALDRERIEQSLQSRRMHLADCERHRVEADEKRTTPPPPVDVAALVPELAPAATTAVRLHPRYGKEPPVDASKLGGQFLWPRDEPWPRCPEHDIPLVTVLQLRAEDFPEMEFRPGSDLFQLLWCPRDHERWVKPWAYWRSRRDLRDVLAEIPEPELAIMDYVPVPCILLPERVTEYPDARDLPRETYERLNRVLKGLVPPDVEDLDEPATWYERELSTCSGAKIGGYPAWVQDSEVPGCDCGRPMTHLLTLTMDEPSRGRWLPMEDRHLVDDTAQSSFGWANAPGFTFGDGGSVYIFICRRCEGWPIRDVTQCC